MKVERQIVNDLVKEQFSDNEYRDFINYDKILIKEADSGIKSLLIYEKAFNNKRAYLSSKTVPDKNGSYENSDWIMDSLRIEKLKIDITEYNWVKSDFKNVDFTIISSDSLRKIIRTGYYLKMPKSLILSISKPLLIDSENALVYYRATKCNLLMTTVDHFMVLMKKDTNKWVKDTYFDDGTVE